MAIILVSYFVGFIQYVYFCIYFKTPEIIRDLCMNLLLILHAFS